MNAKTTAAVMKHGENLQAVFGVEGDPVALCKALRRLEARGAALGLRLCNGPAITEAAADRITAAILDKADKLLGFREKGIPVFLNRDPRGYALKIDDAWMRENAPRFHRDWGGYGIIAPDLTAE